jgi:hypothetical protein
MTPAYGNSIEAITEGMLRGETKREVRALMAELPPQALTACELIATLAILRGAKERCDEQERTTAPVLKLHN